MKWSEITETIVPNKKQPLPAPGQKPWWVSVLAPMTAELGTWGNWSWTTGGCFAFADRLQKAYGGQLWCVARYDPEGDDWGAEHAVVRIGGVFYDFNGVFDPETYMAMLAKANRKKGKDPYHREMKRKGSPGLMWFEDEFLDDKQWKQLLIVLKTGRLVEALKMNQEAMQRIKKIAEDFRRDMETHGCHWIRPHSDGSRRSPDRKGYRRFEGMCNAASRKLAEIYRQNGFDAVVRHLEYHGDDMAYWEQHGRAFYQSDEDFEDATPWEFGESHEVVVIDNEILVDVTSDQFNPTTPSAHRVVVTTVDDRRYR